MTAGWDLVASLLRDDAARPRLVHYDLAPGGVRVELGGKALANWVAKVANLLVDECDVEPGDHVVLDLPVVHWRTAVWVLGCWAAGARAAGPGEAHAARLHVVDAAAGVPVTDAELLGVLALPALARDCGPVLPPAALDLNADVQTQPDAFLAPPGAGAPLPVGRAASAPVTTATLDELGALLVGTLAGARPLVLVTGGDEQTLARIAADERL